RLILPVIGSSAREEGLDLGAGIADAVLLGDALAKGRCLALEEVIRNKALDRRGEVVVGTNPAADAQLLVATSVPELVHQTGSDGRCDTRGQTEPDGPVAASMNHAGTATQQGCQRHEGPHAMAVAVDRGPHTGRDPLVGREQQSPT